MLRLGEVHALAAAGRAKRLASYFGRTRPELPDGCPEKIDLEFIEYVWTFHETTRPRIMSRLAQRRTDQTVVILRSPDDVARFAREVGIGL